MLLKLCNVGYRHVSTVAWFTLTLSLQSRSVNLSVYIKLKKNQTNKSKAFSVFIHQLSLKKKKIRKLMHPATNQATQ